MPRGYRYAVLAFVGTLIAAGQPDKDGAPKGKQPAAQQAQQQRLLPARPPVIRTIRADEPDTGCKQGEDNRRSDLCAQWKAADAAYEGARWSFWQLVLGGFGLLIGGGTLAAAIMAARYARDAAAETKRGADAAENAIAETQRIGEAQVRAFVAITGLKATRTSRGAAFAVTARNSGQSPALDVRFEYTVVHITGNKTTHHCDFRETVPAGQEIELAPFRLKVAEEEWTKSLVVTPKLIFKDVFGREWSTREAFVGLMSELSEDGTNFARGSHARSLLSEMADEEG